MVEVPRFPPTVGVTRSVTSAGFVRAAHSGPGWGVNPILPRAAPRVT